MSIPILNWLAMAFRAPLLQALLIGGAMLLLAVDAATGAVPAWVGAIPGSWLALFLAQRFGGPIYLRRLKAANAAFERLHLGNRLVIVERDRVATDYANHLSFEYALARVAVEPDMSGWSPSWGSRLITACPRKTGPQSRSGSGGSSRGDGTCWASASCRQASLMPEPSRHCASAWSAIVRPYG
jgi:hypothetical protein